MLNFPPEFETRMRTMLGAEYESFASAYAEPPKRGLRVNTLRTTSEAFLSLPEIKGWGLVPTNLLPEGFIITSESGEAQAGKHPYHTAGAYYIQEPSAMSVAGELSGFDFNEDTRILDLCAAPGGKSTAVAAYMQGRGVLVSNEIVKKRADELAKNMERMGVTNAVVTNASPEQISNTLPEYFDVVIVDAPCSGEGMFRKNPLAMREWSPEHVTACANRQGLILTSAARCVKPNGILIYSTCTFSREENEDTVEDFAAKNDFEILKMKRLFPHSSDGEGHFVCVMKKSAAFCTLTKLGKKHVKQPKLAFLPCKDKAFEAFMNTTFTEPPKMPTYITESGKVIFATSEMLDIAQKLPCVYVGVPAGYVKGYFEPSHSLFMAAHSGRYALEYDFAPDSDKLAAFLRGESIMDDALPDTKGFCRITTGGFPIGFCKLTDNTLKNKLPKGLRNNS